MESETTYETSDGEQIEVPVSAATRVEKPRGWGSVPGLEDEELLDEHELERWVALQEWGPVLALPAGKPRSTLRSSIDEEGRVDWGAFATVDFERTYGAFDKARYKMDKLREQLRNVLITLDIVRRRLTTRAYFVLKWVDLGVLAPEHVESDDVLAVLRLRRAADELRGEIADLRAYRAGRVEQAYQRALARLGRP